MKKSTGMAANDKFNSSFLRFIRRKNELAQWSGWSRDFTFLQVSQAGHLEGMRQSLVEGRQADLDQLSAIPPVSKIWKWSRF